MKKTPKTKISGCYTAKDAFQIMFAIQDKIYVDKLGSTTLAEADADEEYFAGLQYAFKYEIDKNKLYIYTNRFHKKMVFLALKD